MTRQVLHAIIMQVNHQTMKLDIFDQHHGKKTLYFGQSRQSNQYNFWGNIHPGDLVCYSIEKRNNRSILTHIEKITQPAPWARQDLQFFSTCMDILITTSYKNNPDHEVYLLLNMLHNDIQATLPEKIVKYIVICKLLWCAGITPKPKTSNEQKAFSLICTPMMTMLNTIFCENFIMDPIIIKAWTKQCLALYHMHKQSTAANTMFNKKYREHND